MYGIAVVPAPHYSLDAFYGFETIMQNEKIPLRNQLQYNTGVIFLSQKPIVKQVFMQWSDLARKYGDIYKNDQPFFTLAMEMENFNPYTLSASYNFRGDGNLLSGKVRIWHSTNKLPAQINKYEKEWPRKTKKGRVIRGELIQKYYRKVLRRIKNLLTMG
jgi:hypothetical protein